jgi:hypothetical protein
MDSARFDTLSRALYDARSRRGLARLLGALTLGGVLTAGTIPTAAKKGGKGKGKGKNKKGKKVTICHNGQTITVSKSALKGHKKHGDDEGPCPTPDTTPPGPCDGLNENDECDRGPSLSPGACCGGVCTRLGTVQNCRACGDTCQAGTETCSGLNSGGDPNSGCCAFIGALCSPLADTCCNSSTCNGINEANEAVCCGVSGSSSCSIGTECCSGNCVSGECAA